ncbi:hypothetical protein CYMTET_12446 [Cymbomonas tetramitiformis]|uniref:Uncharacterized protein n=1 Tax=Cymbomonas tetramitiformis TaxID=36881 RepID=A0AAE0GKB4_9CHLO|nr:hypothetical protein CYMTET_12446 [Cymbomonas tetramitiformis]
MLIEFQRLEEAIVGDMPRDLEGPTDDLVEVGLLETERRVVRAELARVKHSFGRHPARRVEPWEFELLDSKFPACRQEQCGLEELPEGKKPVFDEEWAAAAAASRKRRAVRQPSGSDGEDSEDEEKKRAAAKARFGSLRTATDEELRRALDGSLAVKDITRPPEGEIVVEPEEEREDGVMMASGDREPEPAGRGLSGTGTTEEERIRFQQEAQGVPCVGYLDDFFMVARTAAEAQEMMDLLIEFVTMLGFKAVGVDAGEELLEELAVAVERYQDGAYAESTQRSYDTGVKAFLTFCVEGRSKRGALVPMAHAALVAGLKSLAVQVRGGWARVMQVRGRAVTQV